MMNRQVLLFCVSATLLAGCGNESKETLSDADGRVALQVSSGIRSTLRAYDDTWEAGNAIGIYMFAAGTTDIVEDARNIPYQTASGDGTFAPANGTTPIYFPVDGSNVDFYAWYPYQEIDTEWTANLTRQSSQAAIDLMTASATSTPGTTVYNKDNPSVHLNFRHRLSKLSLKIEPGVGIAPKDLEGLKVEITRQRTKAIYQPEFDGLGTELTSASITLLTNSAGTISEGILFPDDAASNAPLTGRQLIFILASTGDVFYYDIADEKRFKAGEKNLYTITVNRTTLDVTSEITPWTPGNGPDGESGSAE